MNDLQSAFLILSESFSSTSCCFTSGITLKIVAFSLRLHGVVVFIRDKEHEIGSQWQDLAVFFSPSVTPLSKMP